MCLMPFDEPSDDALLWMTFDGRDEDILEPLTTRASTAFVSTTSASMATLLTVI